MHELESFQISSPFTQSYYITGSKMYEIGYQIYLASYEIDGLLGLSG